MNIFIDSQLFSQISIFCSIPYFPTMLQHFHLFIIFQPYYIFIDSQFLLKFQYFDQFPPFCIRMSTFCLIFNFSLKFRHFYRFWKLVLTFQHFHWFPTFFPKFQYSVQFLIFQSYYNIFIDSHFPQISIWFWVSVLKQIFTPTQNFLILPNFIHRISWEVRNVNFSQIFTGTENFRISSFAGPQNVLNWHKFSTFLQTLSFEWKMLKIFANVIIWVQNVKNFSLKW